MSRLFLATAITLVALDGSCLIAQVREFPYDAVVVADEAMVRSGAGDSYYATQALAKDSVVKVLRHDPGGWYMIEPPEGSFSWVPERYVQQLSDTEGEVSNSTAAFVGSEFGPEVTVFQRTLKPGEKVTILDRSDIDTTSGIQTMLKIAPPARERRWIPGAAVVPVDPRVRQQLNTDPYAVPGNALRPRGAIVSPSQIQTADSVARGVTDTPAIPVSPQLANLQQLRSEQQQLAELDRRFRDMVLQDPSGWNLDAIEADYRLLQQSVSHKPVSGQIDMRYPALERYRRRLTQLNEIRGITAQTEQRDAALVARHQGQTAMPGPITAMPFSSAPTVASAGPESMMAMGTPPQLATEFETFLAQSGQLEPTAVAARQPDSAADDFGSVETPAAVASAPANGVLAPGSPQNQYIGAGIVQRADDAGQGFVLASPSGKVLAELKSTGSVKLDNFVGQQVGVLGSRWSEQNKRDIIEVSGLEAVRIRQ